MFVFFDLHAPQTSPSASIDRTAFSIAPRSVSSSQGLTSKIIALLAMTCSSTKNIIYILNQIRN